MGQVTTPEDTTNDLAPHTEISSQKHKQHTHTHTGGRVNMSLPKNSPPREIFPPPKKNTLDDTSVCDTGMYSALPEER